MAVLKADQLDAPWVGDWGLSMAAHWVVKQAAEKGRSMAAG